MNRILNETDTLSDLELPRTAIKEIKTAILYL